MYFHCPPRDRWAALLHDELPADEQADLDAHLEGCPDCQRILEDCAAHRDVWAGARKLREQSPHDFALRTVMERLKTDPDAEPAVEVKMPDILDPSDQPGSLGRINGYEVLQEIGRGGMGIVFKALDPALHRVVAIKVMAPELAVSGSARKRFDREARAAAAVCHEHVVTIHAVEEFKGLPYLVMHYVAGQSVQDKLAKGGPLPVPEILRIGTQVAEGLAAAHKQGIVHRDVKPANILLENGVERVKLTDFSLARAVDDASVTQSGVITGTPQYMSPEQARGEPVDARSDLFGLGSVLYALCTGRPPFRGNPIEVLRKVADETPKPIREQNPEIPAWLEAIVNKLMAKEPANRFASAGDVASLLGRCLAHVQQPAAVPLPAIAGVPPTRRSRWHWAAAVLPILAGLFVVTEATGYTQIVQAVATILRFKTDEGTLVVEVDDPNIKVTLDGKDLVITGAGPAEVRLKQGWHQFLATKDGKVLKDDPVEIVRDGKTSVRVTFAAAGTRVASKELTEIDESRLEAARARLRAGLQILNAAEAELKDAETKRKKGFIPESELRRAQVQRDRAVADQAQAEAELRALYKGAGVDGPTGAPVDVRGATDKRVRIQCVDRRWVDVLDWFSKESGLPFISTHKPTGTFTFNPPPGPDGKPREYTIPEVMDILNEALVQQKFLLVRRKNSFTVVPAEEKIDRSLLPTVTADALPNYGKTELVVLMHHLRNANDQELVPEIRKMMGPFGHVVAWNQMGTGRATMILQDTAGNLTRIVEMLKNAEGVPEKPQTRETLVVPCKYIKAADAVQKLRDLFANDRNYTGQMVTFQTDERTNNVLISGWSGKVADAKKVLETLDVPPPTQPKQGAAAGHETFTYACKHVRAHEAANALKDAFAPDMTRGNIPILNMEVNGETNTLVFTGPKEWAARARKVLRELDVPPPAQPKRSGAPVQTATVPQVRAFEPRLLWEAQVASGSLNSIAVGRGGRLLVGGETDDGGGVLYLLDTASGKTVTQFRVRPEDLTAGRRVRSLAISPDGKTVLAAAGPKLVVFGPSWGNELQPLAAGDIRAADYAPDGRAFATADENGIHIHDAGTGMPTRTLRQGGLWALAYSSDGARIAAGGEDGIARVFEVATGKELDYRVLRGPIAGLDFTPDGHVVAAAKDELSVWVPDTQSGVVRIEAGQKSVYSLAVTASGKYVHSGGTDGTVKVWDVKTGKEVMKVTAPDWQGGVRVFPERPYFLTGAVDRGGPGGRLRLWEIIGVQ